MLLTNCASFAYVKHFRILFSVPYVLSIQFWLVCNVTIVNSQYLSSRVFIVPTFHGNDNLCWCLVKYLTADDTQFAYRSYL